MKDLILGWIRPLLRKKVSKLWRAAPLCLMWAIWKERNKVVFEDVVISFVRLKSFFIRSLSSWARLIPEVDCYLVRGLFRTL